MLYVAMTRAKDELIISRTNTRRQAERRSPVERSSFGRRKTVFPPRFTQRPD